MAKQVINTGTAANSKNGDPLRTAFEKVNANFDELYRNLVSYLPNPAGLSGKFLSTNGTDLLWTSAVKLIQSNTPPDGDSSTLWYDRLGGRVYTWYDDAWVDASPALSDFQLIPPTSPQGAIGDIEGMWSGDFNYYYYCSDNFTGNNAPIWRRVAFDTSNNWAVYNGGGGASLPANAVGYLYNNGSGTITWIPNTQGYTLPQATTSVLGGVIPDGTSIVVNSGVISAASQINADWDSSSGVSAILNKPTIPAAQIQSDWTVTDNTLKSFIKNKPSIPSLSNFAFSANQLTVTNNGAIRLFTNTHRWSFNNNGSLTYPDNSIQVTAYTGTTWPSQVGQGGKFLTTDGNVLSWSTVTASAGTRLLNGIHQVDLASDGTSTFPNNAPIFQNYSYTKTTTALANTSSSIIWTASTEYISSVKLLIQVEADEVDDTSGWHSQVCEAVIASRGYTQSAEGPLGDPAMTIYGLVYTSTQPLVTFTVQRNNTTDKIEVVGTATAVSSGNPTMRIHSVEMATRD
jgi:hypothetical protein